MNLLEQRVAAFLDVLFTRVVLLELAGVLACLAAGWFAGLAISRWFDHKGNEPAPALTSSYLNRRVGRIIAPYVVALVLLMLLRLGVGAWRQDVVVVETAVRLLSAYIVVRIAVLVFESSLGENSWLRSWESRAAFVIWLGVAAKLLDWLDPIIDTLDNVGIVAGKNHITLWSIIKLLSILTLFMVAATWIGRWLERRLMKLQSVALSTRIGISKFASAVLVGLSILLGLNAAGVDLTALNVLTGAIGLGLGFGLQSIAANFV
ncbi:MAG: hypothetical protein JSR95_14635, partial [Proteobacteria bacterium]|nr:hypothetical protein [Pseudomonadota bacterium]